MLLEGLWVSWGQNKVDQPLLRQLLKANDYKVRAAAVEVLRFNGQHVADQASLLMNAAKDDNGNSPLSWASEHLRPGAILSLLTYNGFQISDLHKTTNTSDHGQGWGNSMDWKLLGDYLPE
jgi:HEAT repeat protein